MLAELLTGVGIVTGGGSGIGQATCISMVKYGVRKLAILDISTQGMSDTAKLAREAVAETLEILEVVTDMSNERSIIGAIQQVVKTFGRIDMAVHNAGIGQPIAGSIDMSVKDFQQVLDVNLIGLWACQREVLRQMLAQDAETRPDGSGSRGTIVNVASTYGLVAMAADMPTPAYVTSKHAVIGVTKADAVTYAKEGIRINGVCPGFISTPAVAKAIEISPDFVRKEREKVPMNRFGEPSEIGEAICFLLSPMSSFMTGSSLIVDGGFTSV